MSQDKEIFRDFQRMDLTTLIRQGATLDMILKHHPFRKVYELVKTISVDMKYGLNIDTHNNSDKLYSEILKRFPIEKFPEKYI